MFIKANDYIPPSRVMFLEEKCILHSLHFGLFFNLDSYDVLLAVEANFSVYFILDLCKIGKDLL